MRSPLLAAPDSPNSTVEELPVPLALHQPDQLPQHQLDQYQSAIPQDQLTAENLPQALALAAPERSAEDEYNYKVRECIMHSSETEGSRSTKIEG